MSTSTKQSVVWVNILNTTFHIEVNKINYKFYLSMLSWIVLVNLELRFDILNPKLNDHISDLNLVEWPYILNRHWRDQILK